MAEAPAIPDAVLADYGSAFAQLRWESVAGGFSGAMVFAGREGAEPIAALKAWPAGVDAGRVLENHALQSLAAKSAACIPRLIASRHASTLVIHTPRLWELSEWRPGAVPAALSPARIEAAAGAMAALHRVWAAFSGGSASDAIARRVAAVNAAVRHCESIAMEPLIDHRAGDFILPPLPRREGQGEGLEAARSNPPPAPPGQAREGSQNDAGRATIDCFLSDEAESQWKAIALPILPEVAAQPVHGDLHREHILFTGDALSGIIDFSSIKRDHPALDLARYFGECDAIAAGVAAYHRAGGSEAVTPELVHFLNRVILLGSAAHWIRRFAGNDVPPDRKAAAMARFAKIVERLRAAMANGVSAWASFP